MQGPNTLKLHLLLLLTGALIAAGPQLKAAQVATNWAAFNDHRPGGGTHPNATGYDMRQTGDGGILKDFYTGNFLPVRLVVTHEGTTPDDFGANNYPNLDTPAYNLFNGICDVGNAGIVPVRNRATGPISALIFTFTNLDSSKKYIVAGTATRGNNYLRRWTIATLQSTVSFQNSHQGNGVYTNGTGTIQVGQAAWNSGENRADGAVVSWSDIDPGPDGSFSIRFDQYIDDPLPNGQTPDLTVYGYAFSVVYLAEVGEPIAPFITDPTQPTNRIVLQNRSTTLRVFASGSPSPTYQWYKDGTAIDPAINPTATSSAYVISRMSADDAGDYYCHVSNIVGTVDSRTATVGYMADTVAPNIVRAVGSPGLNQITVEFDEVMDGGTSTDAVNYAVSPPLNVLSAMASPGGDAVILTTDLQTPGTVYTVTAIDVYDLALNHISPANSGAQFRAWIASACSGVLFEAFSSAMTTIATFTNDVNYPNNPFTNVLISHFHSRAAFPDNANNNYGARMRAVFIPQVSGNWRLFMSSDDPGELWFNPTGTSPAGRMRVAYETACCNLYKPPGAIQTSDAFPLIAGQGYYLELIYKENAGGDYGMVAARLDATGIPTGGNDQGAEAGESISGVVPSPFCTVGPGVAPAGVAGTVSINQNLANKSAEANSKATFSVGASAPNAPFVCYQWQKSDDGGATFNDIPGATRPSYTTDYLTAGDDQDIYRVVVGIPGAEVTSANSVLTVTADRTRPRITRVVGLSTMQIAVYYSEPMAGTAAEDPFGYEMDGGVTVGAAVVSASNPLRIDLTVSSSTPMTLGVIYELTASTTFTQVTDPSGNPIDPDPTKVRFQAQNFPGDPDTLITLPTNTKRPIDSLTQRGFNGRYVQVAAGAVNDLTVTEQMLAGTYINPSTGQPYPNIAPITTFVETDTINYTNNGAAAGHILPDRQFPGYTSAQDMFCFEVLTYLELYTGVYRMGVSSDDGFRVTPAKGVADPNNSMVLGFFNGGRAVADTVFDFYVPEDGLYPMRLIWEEGGGDANVEWWIQSLVDNSYIAINGSDAIKAFRPPASGPPTISITRGSGSNVTLSWTDADGSYQLQSSIYLDPPSWSNVSGVTANGDNRSITLNSSTNPTLFFRLRSP